MRFVLIHGGFHGAWCWERVIPAMEKLGHQAIAIDLPAHGARRDERSKIADRRDAIVEIMQPGDVLVGHSGGGYDITFAADAAPERVKHLIYLAAGLPLEGRTVIEATGGAPAKQDGDATQLMSDETGMLQFIQPNARGRMECVDINAVREFFYHDCDDETVRWAFDHLTPAPTEFLLETVHLPNFWRADLPRSFIRCLQDRSMPPSMSKSVIERLGVEPLTIEASHSPFLSKPNELAELFVRAVSTTPIHPVNPN